MVTQEGLEGEVYQLSLKCVSGTTIFYTLMNIKSFSLNIDLTSICRIQLDWKIILNRLHRSVPETLCSYEWKIVSTVTHRRNKTVRLFAIYTLQKNHPKLFLRFFLSHLFTTTSGFFPTLSHILLCFRPNPGDVLWVAFFHAHF